MGVPGLALATMGDSDISQVRVGVRTLGRRKDIKEVQILVEGISARRADLSEDIDGPIARLAHPPACRSLGETEQLIEKQLF